MQAVFRQVDVFSSQVFKGNPLAVVVGADGMSERQMAELANWTNLSETTFLLEPATPGADYRVRIFTPVGELPFAGHPTLGSCHVWLETGGSPRGEVVVQECGAGLIQVRRDDDRLAFAAPPLVRSGPVDATTRSDLLRGLRLDEHAVVDTAWIDNGPGWIGVLLRSRAEVLALAPDYAALNNLHVGVVGPWLPDADGDEAQFEVRAFIGDRATEDPVTGSLNASVAQWLQATNRAPARYIASQGTAINRAGRIHIERSGDEIWVGGMVASRIKGTIDL